MSKSELFIGRLGANPDLRYTMKQQAVCFLSVGTNGQEDGKTTWRRVTVWGRPAEVCSAQMRKGNLVFVQGQQKVFEYTGKDGEKRAGEEVSAQYVGLVLQ